MTTLHHKDYQGSVVYEDGSLVIQILHIDDTIMTQCDRAADAPAAFAELVDDYLETCKALGKNPCRPFKGTFNVRVTPDLHRAAAMAAVDAGESLNSWVQNAISHRVRRDQIAREWRDHAVVRQLVLSRQIESESGWRSRPQSAGVDSAAEGLSMDFHRYVSLAARSNPWRSH